jgi:hypothetical protein
VVLFDELEHDRVGPLPELVQLEEPNQQITRKGLPNNNSARRHRGKEGEGQEGVPLGRADRLVR